MILLVMVLGNVQPTMTDDEWSLAWKVIVIGLLMLGAVLAAIRGLRAEPPIDARIKSQIEERIRPLEKNFDEKVDGLKHQFECFEHRWEQTLPRIFDKIDESRNQVDAKIDQETSELQHTMWRGFQELERAIGRQEGRG